MSNKATPDKAKAITTFVSLLITIFLVVKFCSPSDSSNKRSSKPNISSSTSNVYTPKDNAVLATSEECYELAMAAVSAGDRAAFNILVLDGCIEIYEPSKMNFKLVLLEVGGIAKPNVYYKQGSPSEQYWVNRDMFK